MATSRYSTRSTPRKKYTTDAFEGIEALRSEISSSGDEGADSEDYVDGPDAFHDVRSSSVSDGDEMSGIEIESSAGVSEGPSYAGEHELGDDISILEDPQDDASSGHGRTSTGRLRMSPRKWKKNHDGERLYTRGAPELLHNRVVGDVRKLYYYGPSKHDYAPVRAALRKWGRQQCLPSRITTDDGHRDFAYNSFLEPSATKPAADWQWYISDGGKGALRSRQQLQSIDDVEANMYRPFDQRRRPKCVVMGPLGSQKIHMLGYGQAMSLAELFDTDLKPRTTGSTRNGFLLNVGAKVQSLDWAPNQTENGQYLALSLLPRRELDHPPFEAPEAPSFNPQFPNKSSIQIYKFCANSSATLDDCASPRLSLVLCTSNGEIRSLRWCPVRSTIPSWLGLLAYVASDGSLHVVDVDLPSEDLKTVYSYVGTPAFQSKPPDTVCTCLTWINSNRIAVGCANGCVAVWDLASSLAAASENPRALIYTSVSTTYIVNIATSYPSHPNMLMSTSMTGHVTLTDLNQPKPGSATATVHSNRSRIAQTLIVWHDFSQAALSVDDQFLVRAYPLRRWFATVAAAKYKSLAVCLAVSPCHPFILAGTADGEVVGVNSIRRIALGGRVPVWQQTWFKHDWRPPTAEEEERTATDMAKTVGAATHGVAQDDDAQVLIGKDGLTRIMEGFKAEPVSMNSDGQTGPNVRDGVQFATVYEEKTAVTALAWNPNAHVSGWAAAGMADGLLRVEDIAS